jgi:two-component system, cell cycle sensor histidine kinase and response regulator CckA
MSAEPGDEHAIPALLAALAAPAVLVDRGGLVAAWNGAAQVRFGLSAEGTGQPIATLVGSLADAGRSVALTDDAGSIVVWSLDDDGLGPDELALHKADALGRIAGGIKHDLQNKYQVITGLCELIGTDPGVPAELRDMTGQLAGTAAAARDLTLTTLEDLRHSPHRLELVSVGREVRRIVETLTFAVVNLERRVTIPDSLPQIETELALLRQALLALVVNAIEAQGGTWGSPHQAASGRLLISGSARDDGLGRRVRLAIEDGASVVPEAERATLFSGSCGARAGRDLAVAGAIIGRLGGRLSYEPKPNGNCVVVDLPLPGTALPPPAIADSHPLHVPGSEPRMVLICDDEPLIRGLLTRILERAGVTVVEARDGREALAAIAAKPIRMVLADHQMPDISGSELYDMIVARHPALATQFVLTSGDPGRADVAEFTARTGVQTLAKPFDHDELLRLVREALAD